MSRIFVTGDTHGDIDWGKLNSKLFPEGKNLTKDDYVIICGDFGAIWDGSKTDTYIQKWYDNKPWTTLFIDGNHENFDLLEKYPVTDWNGGKVQFITSSIIHLMRGQIYNIDGRTFFTMGGARSHDMFHRKKGISWWPQEMPTDAEYNEAMENLKKVDNKVDYILTHSAPDGYLSDYFHWIEHDKITNFLETIRLDVEHKHWFAGHMHVDCEHYNKKFTFMYDKIIEID